MISYQSVCAQKTPQFWCYLDTDFNSGSDTSDNNNNNNNDVREFGFVVDPHKRCF